MKDRPRIYIAGPFSGPTGFDVERNVRRAEAYILPIVAVGGCPVCPHTSFRTFDGTRSYQEWIEVTAALLKPCEAILMELDWQESKGAIGEHAASKQIGRRAFYAFEPAKLPEILIDWITQWSPV